MSFKASAIVLNSSSSFRWRWRVHFVLVGDAFSKDLDCRAPFPVRSLLNAPYGAYLTGACCPQGGGCRVPLCNILEGFVARNGSQYRAGTPANADSIADGLTTWVGPSTGCVEVAFQSAFGWLACSSPWFGISGQLVARIFGKFSFYSLDGCYEQGVGEVVFSVLQQGEPH